MLLNGKDLRVLPGGITIFLHVPFGRIRKNKLDARQREIMENIRHRVVDLRDQLYRASNSDSMTKEAIACQLQQSGDIEFSVEDLELLAQCFSQVIEEDRPEASHNVYFNGDQYGIILDDFRDLLNRIKGVLASLSTQS